MTETHRVAIALAHDLWFINKKVAMLFSLA